MEGRNTTHIICLSVGELCDYPHLVLFLLLPLQTDVIGVTGGKNAVGIKHDENTSFPVKIQGAGVEPFELQVQNWTVILSQMLFPVFV